MRATEKQAILRLLDFERQHVLYPGVIRSSYRRLVRDLSHDATRGEIGYCSCSEEEVDQVIAGEIEAARAGGYELEWKLYGHDQPPSLAERLEAAGFVPGDREAFLALSANAATLAGFGPLDSDIRRVISAQGLADYRLIREEISGRDCSSEIGRYALMLEDHPENMSVYVAYVEGEPAACGRVYFHPASQFAALYGGQTRERFRRRGLFREVVAARVREAIDRGVAYVCVDALPTSELILSRYGFEALTYTQPFVLPR